MAISLEGLLPVKDSMVTLLEGLATWIERPEGFNYLAEVLH